MRALVFGQAGEGISVGSGVGVDVRRLSVGSARVVGVGITGVGAGVGGSIVGKKAKGVGSVNSDIFSISREGMM